MNDHEFATTFVVRHRAGSQEGAVFQRNEWVKAVEQMGGEVTMADTKPDDAGEVGLAAFLRPVEDND